jgi:hypothetical protein
VKVIITTEKDESMSDSKNGSGLMGKVVGDYVIELPVIREVDFDKALKFFEENYGKYANKFGCTATAKKISNGHTIVGRSYDLSYSFAPAYLVRTNIPGHLKTVGVAYNGFKGASFEDVKKNGLSETELLTVYCMTGDVLNEKGFYIEANMRGGQPAETGIKECSGTNPGAKVRLSFATLIRYLGERAGTVDEALEIIKTLDVYGFKTEKLSWGGGLFMADATGHYGVLELVDNRLMWNDMQKVQANFYINPEYRDRATVGTGMGRYNTVMKGWDAVDSREDMLALIRKVKYLQMFDPDTCQFDPLGELTESVIDGKKYYIKDVTDEKNRKVLMDYLKKYIETVRCMSLDEMRANNDIWLSAYQTVVDCNERTMRVQFFEDNRLVYHLCVDDVE